MSIETPFDPEERRIEAMMDGSGFSRESAEIALGRKVVTGSTELPPSPRPPRTPRPTGHVRGFHEGEKRLSEEYPDTEDLTAEQTERNNAWIARIRKERADGDIQRIVDEVHRMIPLRPDYVAEDEAERERVITARVRTYFERKQ